MPYACPCGLFARCGVHDPSVMTFGVQALVGIIIAADAVLFVWWRKVKHKVSKTLHIDENAGKEGEEDIVVHDDSVVTGDSYVKTPDADSHTEGSQDNQNHSAPEA